MRIIGLTGRMGTGKSTVAQALQEFGAGLIDADELGHLSYEPGGECYKSLLNIFGVGIVSPDGPIDRNRLAQRAFADPILLEQLNDITRPVILRMAKARLEQLRRNEYPVAVLEAALLVEAGWTQFVDEVWLTVAPEAVIHERLTSCRGFTEADILPRLSHQLPDEILCRYADVIIDTSGRRDKLRLAVLNLCRERFPELGL